MASEPTTLKLGGRLVFNEVPFHGKTKRFYVVNRDGHTLGQILFRPGWRRYVLDIQDMVCFDAECLEEIVTFLKQLNEAHHA